MQETTYKKDSWAYRINTSHNMLIPHLSQRYGYDENMNYGKLPPEESCTYWQNVLLYVCIQLPLLFMVGLAFGFMFIFLPITSVVFYFATFIYLPELLVGFLLLGLYGLLGLFITFMLLKGNEKASKYITPVINDISEMYDCLKEKYCKKLNFK